MSLAEAKAHLSEVVHRVSSQHERMTVTVHGRASAILLAPDDLERREEAIAVLSDAALSKEVSDAETEVEAGRIESAEELAAAMRRRAAG